MTASMLGVSRIEITLWDAGKSRESGELIKRVTKV